jgi:hypothetical protein
MKSQSLTAGPPSLVAPARRKLLLQLAAWAVAAPSAVFAQRGEQPGRPLVGALRWDAWYVPGSEPTTAVERSLSPPQYQARLPFFAHRDARNQVSLPALSPNLMELEIEQAAYAGLDFWAFVGYPGDSPMTVALRQYLAGAVNRRIGFCMFTQLEYWGTAGAPAPLIDEHIALMRHEAYVRVTDGRPLYFLGFITAAKADERWHDLAGLHAQIERFRARAIAAGAGNPYLVLGGPPKEIAALAPMLGGDAAGTYAITDGRGIGDYAALVRIAEAGWRTLAGADMPVVPTVMTGWDRRPRVEHPVPWEREQRPGVGLEYHFGAARPEEIAAHLRHALAWVQDQPADRRAPAALIYAWNENDEGGWLLPTLPCDTRRLQALHAALAPGRPGRPPGCAIAP